ncbi:hypothetical protein G6F59_018677 [Rhizopus arrhizus]|nr:hypothetical protein G6F59_018677 [Rhizopus arrhizus]
MMLARAAERSLDVQYYIWHDDMTGTMLLEALHELLQQTRHVREDATSAAQVAIGQQRPLSQRELMSVLLVLQATPSDAACIDRRGW